MRILINRKSIEYTCWFAILLILFYQSVLQEYSIISNAALLVIAVLQFSRMGKEKMGILVCVTVWILFLIGYSVLLGNQISLAFRFGIILLLVIFSYLWKVDYVFFLKALFVSSFGLVIALFCLEGYMFTCSYDEYSMLRNNFFLANDMGDVFWWDIYYKLELRGTPLIVFVYMLSYVADIFPHKFKVLYRILYFIASILAGNFAYQMALLIFHVSYYIMISMCSPRTFAKKMFWFFVLLILLGGIASAFISSQMETKEEGSTPARVDQMEVLNNNMSESMSSFVFGTGLGNTIEKETFYRNYRGSIYYELQPLYFLNQLGWLNFFALIVTNIILSFRFIKRKELILVYCVYVLYASTNPYILDTTQIVVIVSLLCAKAKMENRRTSLSQIKSMNFSFN